MTRAAYAISISALIAFLLTACARHTDPTVAPVPAVEVSSADESANIELSLAADRSSITTLDRLDVTITLRRPVASPVTLTEPSWESAGWTRIDAVDAEPRAISNNRIERSRTITIEPYLAGNYAVPPASIEWTVNALTRTLQTPEISIRVASVLTPSDAPELAEPASTLPVPDESKANTTAQLIISFTVLAGALLIWRVARRPGHTDEIASPADTIRAIANNAHPSDSSLADLHRALTQAKPTPDSHAPLQALINRCEIARFAPADRAPSEQPNPREIAIAALELIATDHAEASP